MENSIIVNYRDGTKMEMNKVINVIWAGGNLIIQFCGIFGEIDSKTIDDISIKDYSVNIRGN